MRRPPFRISPGRVALSAAPATSRMPVARSRSDASGGASYALNSRCCRLTRPVAESVIATSTAYRPGRAAKAKCSASDALATPSIAAGTLWLHDCEVSSSPALSCTVNDTRYAAPPRPPPGSGLTAEPGTCQKPSPGVPAPASENPELPRFVPAHSRPAPAPGLLLLG